MEEKEIQESIPKNNDDSKRYNNKVELFPEVCRGHHSSIIP